MAECLCRVCTLHGDAGLGGYCASCVEAGCPGRNGNPPPVVSTEGQEVAATEPWQPIAIAPKVEWMANVNGEVVVYDPILCWWPDAGVHRTWWEPHYDRNEAGTYVVCGGRWSMNLDTVDRKWEIAHQPTHWMPLPPPPTATTGVHESPALTSQVLPPLIQDPVTAISEGENARLKVLEDHQGPYLVPVSESDSELLANFIDAEITVLLPRIGDPEQFAKEVTALDYELKYEVLVRVVRANVGVWRAIAGNEEYSAARRAVYRNCADSIEPHLPSTPSQLDSDTKPVEAESRITQTEGGQ